MTGRIGVYGARGWVGSAVVARLADRGTPHVSFAAGADQGAVDVPREPRPEQLVPLLTGLQAVVITAGRAHVPDAEAPEAAFANAMLPAVVVEAARRAKVRHVVLLSSIKAVAEHASRPCRPIDPPRPTTTYGRSKLLGEQRALGAAGADVGLTIVRSPLVVGAEPLGSLGRLVKHLRRGLPVPLPAPYVRRSVVLRGHLSGLLIHLAATCNDPGQRIVHVSEEEVPDTRELVEYVAAGLGVVPRVIPVPAAMARVGLRLLGRDVDAERLARPFVVQPAGSEDLCGWAAPAGLRSGVLNEFGRQA